MLRTTMLPALNRALHNLIMMHHSGYARAHIGSLMLTLRRSLEVNRLSHIDRVVWISATLLLLHCVWQRLESIRRTLDPWF